MHRSGVDIERSVAQQWSTALGVSKLVVINAAVDPLIHQVKNHGLGAPETLRP